MSRIGFEGLPSYTWPGGQIAGNVVVEADKPLRGRQLTLQLTGREVAQVTVQAGKSRQTLVQEAPILEREFDVQQALAFVDPNHVQVGVYRAPFQFELPPTVPPSIHTRPYEPQGHWLAARPDGLYVEYVLEARLVVPMWPDLVATSLVPVYGTRRVLGALPATVQTPSNPGHPSVTVSPPSPMVVVPGSTLQLPYEIDNPGAKTLRFLQFELTRVVEYRARGAPGFVKSPTFAIRTPIGGKEASYQGELELAVPNTEDTTGPWQGQTFVTYWTARLVLDVELGFNVETEVPLASA